MKSTAVAVQTVRHYRDYAEMLYHEVPVFLERVLESLGLRYRTETDGDDYSTWHDHWIETRLPFRLSRGLVLRVATITAVPGFADGPHRIYEDLRIKVLRPRYLGECQELARRFERAFGLRTKVTY